MKRALLSTISVAALSLVMANSALADATAGDNGVAVSVPITDSLNGNAVGTDALAVTDSNKDNNVAEGDSVAIRSSFNGNSLESNTDSHDTITRYRAVSDQELNGNVTNSVVEDNGRSGRVNFSGGAFSGFGGINTANTNTGYNSVNQAATSIAANANVSFD